TLRPQRTPIRGRICESAVENTSVRKLLAVAGATQRRKLHRRYCGAARKSVCIYCAAILLARITSHARADEGNGERADNTHCTSLRRCPAFPCSSRGTPSTDAADHLVLFAMSSSTGFHFACSACTNAMASAGDIARV